MSAHGGFLDRMTRRLDQLGRQLADASEALRTELAPMLQVQRDRLAELRRMGAELPAETTQSFAAAVERLAARIGGAERDAA
jgi:hypothetical protein